MRILLFKKSIKAFGPWLAAIESDGGTVEGKNYIESELSESSNASMAMIPGAYKSGVLYCPIPIDRSADFTVARASLVNTIGEDSQLRSLGNNVPAIDHSEGYPRLLAPDASTNLFLNNAVLVTQNVSTIVDTYTVSFYGTGTISFSGSYAGADLVGTGVSQRVTRTFTAASGTLTVTVTGSCTNAQLEELTYASPPITTLGVTSVRAAVTIHSGGAATCINSEEGVFIYKGKAFAPGAFRMLTISDGTNNNRVGISYDNGGNLLVFFTVAGVSVASHTFASSTQTNENVIAFMWQLNNFKIYLNGVEVFAQASGTVPSVGTFTEVGFANGNGGLAFKADTKAILIYEEIAKATLDYNYIIE
jgi:hypothetical protein